MSTVVHRSGGARDGEYISISLRAAIVKHIASVLVETEVDRATLSPGACCPFARACPGGRPAAGGPAREGKGGSLTAKRRSPPGRTAPVGRGTPRSLGHPAHLREER